MTEQDPSTTDDTSSPIPLPVEPLYDMWLAALMVPANYAAFKSFLSRNRHLFPARYRLAGRGHRRIRQISASEIRLARQMLIRLGR
jgi:hypothetical protein